MIATLIAATVALTPPIMEVLPRSEYRRFIAQARQLHVPDREIVYAIGVAEYVRVTGQWPKESEK